MPQLTWLDAEQAPYFPPTHTALDDPEGLLAAGGALSSPWLLLAYKNGIFPWFSEGEPIMWWSPAPRMVLPPGTAHVGKSVRKLFRKSNITIKVNHNFAQVIEHCSDESLRNEGTWITDDMKRAYCALHEQGWAHSVEVYDHDDELVGGLYGLGIFPVFYGESMFSLTSGASKFAFIALSEWAKHNRLALIDCQLYNPYLDSLGAYEISRVEFEQQLPKEVKPLSLIGKHDLTQLLINRMSKTTDE